MPDILDVIFAFCQEYQTLLILLYNNNLSHILLNKWNTFIPEVHEEIVTTEKPFYQKYNTLNVSYILAFNIGSIWNIITKWIANDMKETPEEIKDTIVAYLKDIALFIWNQQTNLFSSCMLTIYPHNKGLSAHFYPYFEGVANIVTSIFLIHTILSDNKNIITLFSNHHD